MNAIIYTRVSTDEQAKFGYSLSHQKTALETYCRIQGIEIVAHFQDDYSAKDFESRPAFTELLQYANRNKKNIDLLLFTKWDRFSRNQELSLGMLRNLSNLGITANSIEQPLDMNLPDNKAMLALYLVMPEIENDKISIRTKEGMRKAMRMGYFMGHPPIGYKNFRTEDKHSTLIIDKQIEPLIKAAFEEFGLGIYSAEEVRKKLLRRGLKVSKQGFLNLLRNITYTGKILIPAWKKEDEEIVSGIHEPIIDESLFKKVQIYLNNNKPKSQLKIRDDEFPLRGHLVCDCCEKKLTASFSKSRNGNRYGYYHSNNGCKTRFSASLANDKFIDYLEQFQLKPEIAALYLAIMKDVFSDEEKGRLIEKKKLEDQITLLIQRLESLTEKYIDNKLDQSTYQRTKDKLEHELLQTQTTLDQINIEKKKLDIYLGYGISFLSGLKIFYISSPTKIKKQIVGSIFPENIVFSNEKYRTTKLNSFVELLFNNTGQLQGIEKRKAAKISGLSRKAPPLGLEPRTL